MWQTAKELFQCSIPVGKVVTCTELTNTHTPCSVGRVSVVGGGGFCWNVFLSASFIVVVWGRSNRRISCILWSCSVSFQRWRASLRRRDRWRRYRWKRDGHGAEHSTPTTEACCVGKGASSWWAHRRYLTTVCLWSRWREKSSSTELIWLNMVLSFQPSIKAATTVEWYTQEYIIRLDPWKPSFVWMGWNNCTSTVMKTMFLTRKLERFVRGVVRNIGGQIICDRLARCFQWLKFPFQLVVAVDQEESDRLDGLFERGLQNEVPGLKLVGPDEIKEIEHNCVVRQMFSFLVSDCAKSL